MAAREDILPHSEPNHGGRGTFPGLLITGALAGIFAVFLWWFFYAGAPVNVDIPPGLSAGETARLLHREGVLRGPTLFKLLAKWTGMDRKLKPGRYALRKRMAAPAALWYLYRGQGDYVRIVIPEGFMAMQMAQRLEAADVTQAQAFMKHVRENNLEGYLFPTTYFFSPGLSGEAVAHHMHLEFRKNVEPEFQKAAQSRFTLAQVVTLASIVEREARLKQEMPMIAAVYINRLKKRMRLEADPTVQYALGKDTGQWKKNIRYKDLRIVSRYNTYLYFGLPPGPICSPGLGAVKAVLYPAKSDAVYFVADHTGGHTFSQTLQDHVRAKTKAKRQARQMR